MENAIQKFVGISARTAELIEQFRQSPRESEDEIIQRLLASPARKSHWSGLSLGNGVSLEDGEQMFLFRRAASKRAGKPDAVANVRDGQLWLYDQPVPPSPRGSFVKAALDLYQARVNDKNERGEFISLDAWDYWFVKRDGQFVRVGDLRTTVHRRGNKLTLADLGL